MRPYSLTRQARADVIEIWSYIAADSFDAANRVEDALFQACQRLADDPMLGHVRKDFTKRPLRFWTLTRFRNYTIVYSPATDPLEIIAVLHGKRDLRRAIKNRP